jgi:hypothetical protein
MQRDSYTVTSEMNHTESNTEIEMLSHTKVKIDKKKFITLIVHGSRLNILLQINISLNYKPKCT